MTTDNDTFNAWMSKFDPLLRSATGNLQVELHGQRGLLPLYLALGGAEPVWVVANLAPTGDRDPAFKGKVAVFSSDLVAVANLESAPTEDRYNTTQAPASGKITVIVVPRTSLESVEVETPASPQGPVQTTPAWNRRAVVTLRYTGLTEPFVAKMDAPGLPIEGFYSALMDDLAK